MTDESPRDLDWPTRRWLLWGIIAIAVLAAVVLFFVWFADDETSPAEEAAEQGVGPQVEWSIVLTSQTGDTVTLKGDLPNGNTTETWLGEAQLIRSPGGTFEWNMDQELPVAVVEIDDADGCTALNDELDAWVEEIANAVGEPQHWQARAFAQHALNTMQQQSCEIDEAALAEIAGGG